MSVGDNLKFTLELRHGNVRIAYWAKTGTSVVIFSETYTLKAHGTIVVSPLAVVMPVCMMAVPADAAVTKADANVQTLPFSGYRLGVVQPF